MTNNFTKIDDLVQRQKGKKVDDMGVSLPKEAEPIGAEKFEIKEVVEHKVEDEVKPFVSPRQDTIELPPDLQNLGLQPVGQSQFSTYKNIKLPISDEKIVVGLKAPINSSLRWLATFSEYILHQAHLGLKVISGKVIRVIRS